MDKLAPRDSDGASLRSESSLDGSKGQGDLPRTSYYSVTSSSRGNSNAPEREEFEIAKDEDNAVFRIRLAVVGFLTLCTVGVAIMVYLHTRDNEQEEYEAALYEFSSKVFGSLGTSFDQSLAAIDAYVVASVSFAKAMNMTWPFVTIPDSGTKLSKLLSVSRATTISVIPAVQNELLDEWNAYSLAHGPIWVDDNLRVQRNNPEYTGVIVDTYEVSPLFDNGRNISADPDYFPQWQSYPTASSIGSPFNYDFSKTKESFELLRSGRAELSDVVNEHGGYNFILSAYVGDAFDFTEPVSEFHYPIYEAASSDVLVPDDVLDTTQMVGFVWVSFYWRNEMLNMLPAGAEGIIIVVSTSSQTCFTYEINGPDVVFLGFGDHHDHAYDDLSWESNFHGLRTYAAGSSVYSGLELAEEANYTFQIYPSAKFEADYISANPLTYTVVTVAIFVFTSLVFWVYDVLVERRQKKVMSRAVKSSAIVSSLFPSNVRDRLYNVDAKDDAQTAWSQKKRLKTFMNHTHKENFGMETASPGNNVATSGPIADLFPEVTVMFADIAGFTAWSSTREPSQVFVLLESLYGRFDKLATRRGVFKVETIGDCYVAVAGLPDPRKDHAVVIVKFARDCCIHMQKLTAKLSVSLGPDTEDLCMRFGLNSGPVTAGVLRGQKSRFQLFGDTVNTAARMESTGEKNRIQVSQSTADELIKHEKGHWLHSRQDAVAVKGKGMMATYWVNPREDVESSDGRVERRGTLLESAPGYELPTMLVTDSNVDKIGRLVDWNTDVLTRLLRSVIARRSLRSGVDHEGMAKMLAASSLPGSKFLPIDEVKEIIELPNFNPKGVVDDPDLIQLDTQVMEQLHDYVEAIADTYHGSKNPFHNFEHASHVCMSVSKLMSRILAVDEFFDQEMDNCTVEAFKHQQTFGIASDPLTLFACAFAALIHDADHPGVPNSQVVKEGTEFAKKYGNRSVAEQRSVDVGWSLLMQDKYTDLRNAICPTGAELKRFRQLIVNSVMATDIMDKDLKQLRNARWDKAFDSSIDISTKSVGDSVNRKATIVIEHLIQASDVAHTMQHWHVFRKWNERLFMEMYQAYKAGRAEVNPAEFWYKGELSFFDFYILPLAKKLSDCGVFGVSSDEYLNYALKNREEWERKGEQVVVEMIERWEASTH